MLDSQVFARALIDLVRKTSGPGLIPLREEEEGNLIELLFGVANKIRLDPDILPAWFYPDRPDAKDGADEKAGFAGVTRKNAFPLFYCLVEYVYHDGRTGDFARTGLLYLTETASKSSKLEKWMIESDLAALMASGLGALYSRLSRRLPATEDGEFPPVLALSDFNPQTLGHDTTEFHPNVDAFLSFLLFWQDTLDHCASAEVTDTLLDHFQVLFLEQLLYPSLLESSDVDGGSTASVIVYLTQILESLDHPGMIRRILEFLLAAPSQKPYRTPSPAKRPKMSLSRRKSLDVLTALIKAENKPSPDFFNLVDLISMSLRSRHDQTVVAALQLLTVILRRHHTFAFDTLFKVSELPSSRPQRALLSLNAEIKALFELSMSIRSNATSVVDEAYEDLLLDVVTMLESHSCAQQKELANPATNGELLPGHPSRVVLIRDDFLLGHLVVLLERFFSNDTLTNLALTETIISIASCSRVMLDDWLLASRDIRNGAEDSPPPIYAAISALIYQVKQWRAQISDWDEMLADMKSRMSGNGPDKPTQNNEPAISSEDRKSRSSSARQSLDLGAQMLNAYSESVTPRGRNIPQRNSDNIFSIDKTISPSPGLSSSQRRSQFLSPLRRGRGSVTTSNTDTTVDVSQSSSLLPEKLKQQISLETNSNISSKANPLERLRRIQPGIDSPGPSSGTLTPRSEQEDEPTATSVSLSRIIINAIILQNFLLEIAALVQTRAGLYGEVRFD